jgi:hypothetical protein
MTNEVMVAAITASGGVIVAALSYFLTKRQQREAAWRDSKLNHYKALLSAISDLAVNNQDVEAHHRFALAMNTLALVAPQKVVDAMLAFHDGVKSTSEDRSAERHDQLLAELLLAIRADVGIKPKDDQTTFKYHLVGAPPRKKK